MAEAILSDLAGTIVEGLGNLLVKEIGVASGVKRELRKLEESLSKIKAILLDAEKKSAMDNVVKDWLKKLNEIAYDAEDVLDEFATEALRRRVELPNNILLKQVRRCFSLSNHPLVFRFKMGHKIKTIIERFDSIQQDALFSKFIESPSTPQSVDDHDINDDRRQTDPFVIESEVLGREKDKEQLVQLLTRSSGGASNEEEKVMTVIPIIGIGGLGKTTLAQCVYNDVRVETYFELQMWVCVSFDFNVTHIARKILNDQSGSESQLREKVSGKRYLLVLDDVWNENAGKWEDLRKLLIGGASGSMILVTTRNQTVASTMAPDKMFYNLKGLNENDCESLFNKRAFVDVKEATNHPKLIGIGKAIVKKCGGLPLTAKALGASLRLYREESDWLAVLKTGIWNNQNNEGEDEILPALMISYNCLPSHLKQCFAYCSLFTQDDGIDVNDLIYQWMAHGFIQPPPRGSPLTIQDIGYKYFRELLWRSFFQEEEKDDLGNIRECKMHDLMHNLARWVAGKKMLVEESTSSSSSSSSSSLSRNSNTTISISSEAVKHMVFRYSVFRQMEFRHMVFLEIVDGAELNLDTNPYTLLIRQSIDKAQNLRTLHLQCKNRFLELRVFDGLVSSLQGLRSLRSLRLLKLTGLGMKHVPSYIKYLKQLRYLDLSENEFQVLPNFIGSLYNLQTLRLDDCYYFIEWPEDMKKMVSLRNLNLSGEMNIQYMPRGLGQLTSLQTLDRLIVGNPIERKKQMCGVGELRGLNQLQGELFIGGLGNVRDSRDAEEANLTVKSKLQSLIFSFSSDIVDEGTRQLRQDETILRNLQPPSKLKKLKIYLYQGTKMPHWMIRSSSFLPYLVELKIDSCCNLKCLPLIGEFPCLKCLCLSDFTTLESICNKVVVPVTSRGGEGKPSDVTLFPSLRILLLDDAPKLESWTISVVQQGEEEAPQHNHNLHLLSSIFPLLTELDLINCGKLTTVPMFSVEGIQHLTSLRRLRIRYSPLVSLADFPAHATLEELSIENCPSLERLPDCFFANLKLLSTCNIMECRGLKSLPKSIQHLTALKSIRIQHCDVLTTLPEGLGNLASLQELSISDCPNLSSLPQGIQHLTALKCIRIVSCEALTTLPEGLGNLASLQELSISDCPNLSSLPQGIQHLTALKYINIENCEGLTTLPEGLGNLTSLQELSIRGCPNLSSHCIEKDNNCSL